VSGGIGKVLMVFGKNAKGSAKKYIFKPSHAWQFPAGSATMHTPYLYMYVYMS